MTKTSAGTERARHIFALLLLIAFCLCALWPIGPAAAQSGRRKTAPAKQSPAPPAPSVEPQGESESQPRRAPKSQSVIATFIVCEDEQAFLNSSITSRRDIIGATFFDRLRQSSSVAVERGGKATRSEARDRAKKEREAYVVLLQLEEDMMAGRGAGQQQIGRMDTSNLALRVYVYAPGSGDLKFTDYVTQRPYRSSTSVGGVRIPVPVRGAERYPGEYQLAQAARDAADRLLSRFEIARPPEN